MKQRLFLAALLIIATTFFSGCATLESVLNLKKPTASLDAVKFGEISLDSATLIFDVEVNNPYSVSLPLTNIDYKLATGSNKLLSGKADIQSTIPAGSSKTVSLPAKISYLDLVNAFKNIRPGSSIPYNADMSVSLDTPAFGTLTLPLKKDGQISVPEIPDLKEIDWKTNILDTIKEY